MLLSNARLILWLPMLMISWDKMSNSWVYFTVPTGNYIVSCFVLKWSDAFFEDLMFNMGFDRIQSFMFVFNALG
jgi:hypothetical protein